MNSFRLLDLALDDLDRVAPDASWNMGEYVTAACLLEAAAPKAGNVHPRASFDDMNYEDFRRSAQVVGNVFDRSDNQSIGSLVLSAVQATHAEVGKNTNLGIVLLLAPLTVSVRQIQPNAESNFRDRWKRALASKLESLTVNDSQLIYQAIAIAKPGGIGRVEQMDIREAPPDDLLDAMRLAAAWDDIAKQYATGFLDVFELSAKIDAYRQQQSLGWLSTLVSIQVERLASHGDSLIARKNNGCIVEQVQQLANSIARLAPAAQDRDDLTSTATWRQLDDYLRADGHRRNPGTTADLLAAATFVSLLSEYNSK